MIMRRLSILLVCAAAMSILLLLGCGRNWRDDQAEVEELRTIQEHIKEHPDDVAAIRTIIAKTDDRSFITRANSIAVLGNIGVVQPSLLDEFVLPYLKKGLRDNDPGVRRVSAAAFTDIAPDAVAKAVPEMVIHLRRKDAENEDVLAFLIEALGRAGQSAASAVPIITEFLEREPPAGVQDEAPQLRIYAADSLGNIGSPAADDAIPKLTQTLSDPNPYFQMAAAKAVLKLRPQHEKALRTIERFRQSPDPTIRRWEKFYE